MLFIAGLRLKIDAGRLQALGDQQFVCKHVAVYPVAEGNRGGFIILF